MTSIAAFDFVLTTPCRITPEAQTFADRAWMGWQLVSRSGYPRPKRTPLSTLEPVARKLDFVQASTNSDIEFAGVSTIPSVDVHDRVRDVNQDGERQYHHLKLCDYLRELISAKRDGLFLPGLSGVPIAFGQSVLHGC